MNDAPRPMRCPACRRPLLLLNMTVQATPYEDGFARPVGQPVLPLLPLPATQVTCNAEGCHWHGVVADAVSPDDCPECRRPDSHHHPACPNS